MKTLIVNALLAGLLASHALAAEPAKVVAKALGVIPNHKTETGFAIELSKALRSAPDARIVVVTGDDPFPDHTQHYRWFYDRKTKTLAMMLRTAMPAGSDSFNWVVFYDVQPEDFKDSMPFQRKDIRSEWSADMRGDPKLTFPVKIPDSPQVAVWP